MYPIFMYVYCMYHFFKFTRVNTILYCTYSINIPYNKRGMSVLIFIYSMINNKHYLNFITDIYSYITLLWRTAVSSHTKHLRLLVWNIQFINSSGDCSVLGLRWLFMVHLWGMYTLPSYILCNTTLILHNCIQQ